ncbi:hypothetical protein SEA_PEPE25_39 [Microbacterium phage Pepe25]|nr:hypothetical protein SEA_PEPE25_39 [Microbacterium phage Pepe25]
MASSDVLTILAASQGGFNMDVPGKQIGVEILSDTEAIYTLGHHVSDQPTGYVERYALTLVELDPILPEESTEGDASIGDVPLAE